MRWWCHLSAEQFSCLSRAISHNHPLFRFQDNCLAAASPSSKERETVRETNSVLTTSKVLVHVIRCDSHTTVLKPWSKSCPPPSVLTGLCPIKKKGLSFQKGLIVFSVSASTDALLRLHRFPFNLSVLYYAGNYVPKVWPHCNSHHFIFASLD